MFCMVCGNELENGTTTCNVCGYSMEPPQDNIMNVSVAPPETKLVPAQCTNCNAALEVNPAQDAAICPYCNTPYIVEKAIQNIHVNNHVNIANASLNLDGVTLAINNQPTIDVDNYVKRAHTLRLTKEYDKAIEYLEKVLDINADHSGANEEMTLCLISKARMLPVKQIESIYDLLTKAQQYDRDTDHKLITDYLLYMGITIEKALIVAKETYIHTNDYLIAYDIYKKALSIHPESESIALSVKRLNYILNEHVYYSSQSHGIIYEARMNNLVIRNQAKIINTIPYSGITNIQDGSEIGLTSIGRVYFKLNGKSSYMAVGLLNTDEWLKILNNYTQGLCYKPSYAELEKKQLIQSDDTSYKLAKIYDQEALLQFLNA
ncbi:MAG: hypothetical protein IJ648_04245 [Lachnospiraceae bacterium]|nr:hypothetical protein [Lachnospiraceae bacterium]